MSKDHKINVTHLAKLSSLSVTAQEAADLEAQLESTLDTVSMLDEPETEKVNPTSQVTGRTNVFRKDNIQSERVFSQKQALANATHDTHKGYFVVEAVIES